MQNLLNICVRDIMHRKWKRNIHKRKINVEKVKKSKRSRVDFIELIKEFTRYLMVGGMAFLLDAATLHIFSKYVLKDLGDVGILLSAALGFIVGLVFNYILSVLFVFDTAKEKVKGSQVKFFSKFAIIGIGGLILTEIGIYVGISVLGNDMYILAKVIVAGVVLVWNYGARKIFIFN